MKYKKITKITDEWLKKCYENHNVKIPIAYNGYIIQAVLEVLDEYNKFLLKTVIAILI